LFNDFLHLDSSELVPVLEFVNVPVVVVGEDVVYRDPCARLINRRFRHLIASVLVHKSKVAHTVFNGVGGLPKRILYVTVN
jgi:hypothetical protein